MKGRFRNIVFVCPDPSSFISGGNIYNLNFLKALRRFDPAIQNIDFDAFRLIADADKKDLYFIDTIYFDEIRKYKGDLSQSYLIVHHLESLNVSEAERSAYVKKEESETLDRFGGFLCTSNFTKSYLISLGYEKAPYLTLPPAIAFKPKRRQKSTKQIDALMVNNLMERKGILEFLKALSKTEIKKERFQLTIIGSDTLEPDYAQKCKALLRHPKLQELVKYIGVLSHAQVKRYFETSNLYLSAAFMETFGIAMQEAVAYRMPLLAIDGGSTSFHIDEFENGYLFDNSEELIETLDELCGRPEEFERLVKSAWKFRKFEKYSWEEVISDFVNQLKD